MAIDGPQDQHSQSEIARNLDLLSNERFDGAREDQARVQLGSHQPSNFLNQYGLAMRLKGPKPVEVQDQCLMPGHGLLVVVSKPRIDRNTCPFSYVADIAWSESLDRVESMGCSKVATTEEKTQLIGGRSQLASDLQDGYRKIEVAFALGAIEQRG
jgi:hypothetical protein